MGAMTSSKTTRSREYWWIAAVTSLASTGVLVFVSWMARGTLPFWRSGAFGEPFFVVNCVIAAVAIALGVGVLILSGRSTLRRPSMQKLAAFGAAASSVAFGVTILIF